MQGSMDRAVRVLLALVLAGAALAAGTAAAGSPGAQDRVALSGGVPEFATQAHRVRKAHGQISFAVALRWRHASQLNRLDAAVSDPGSPRYSHYLSPTRFRQRFAPTRAQLSAVRRWLEAQELRVTGISASRMLISVSGSVSRVERAFGTSLAIYRVAGQRLRAPAEPVSIPALLRQAILAVPGLAETPYSPAAAPPGPVTRTPGPCSMYWGAKIARDQPAAYGSKRPWAVCGYTPAQFESAYGVRRPIKRGLDGSGQRVGIIDAFESPTLRHDLNEFSRLHGLPPARLRIKRFFGCHTECDAASQQDWYGEQTLDVESVHTMAPRAKIRFIGAADPDTGLLKAITWAVDHRVARIISNSYGGPDPLQSQHDIRAEEQVAKQAIAEGIGLYFSTGDHGDNRAEFGFVSTSYPASSPRVTAMGGTTLAIGPVRNFRFETGWGLHATTKSGGGWSPAPPGPFQSGSTGGTTKLFVEPRYQRGVVPTRLARVYGGRGRVVPDISMDGDPSTGTLVGQTQRFPDGSLRYHEYVIGGTSLASPLFAGYMALADQAAGFHHGFVNPALYRLYGRRALRDVRPVRQEIAQVANVVNPKNNQTQTALITGDMDSSLRTTKGFDNTSGLGSPRGIRLLRALRHR